MLFYQLEHASELNLVGHHSGGTFKAFGTKLKSWPQTLMVGPQFHRYELDFIRYVDVPYIHTQSVMCYCSVARYVKVAPPNLDPDDGVQS